MREPIGERRVRLAVRNFGPIKRADLDLRPLTVFVGPSNTGKSYLATLVYALHKFFSGRRYISGRHYGIFPRHFIRGEPVNLDTDRADAITNWFDGLHRVHSEESHGLKAAGRFPPEVEATITESIQGVYENGDSLVSELVRCFGLSDDLRDLVRAGTRDEASVHLEFGTSGSPDGHPMMEWEFTFGSHKPRSRPTIRPQPDLKYTERQALGWISDVYAEPLEMAALDADDRAMVLTSLIGQVARDVLPQLIGSMNEYAHYLPADRAGVMHAHRSIVGAIVRSAPMAGLRPLSDIPSVSGVVADFLDWLINIDEQSSRRFSYQPRPAKELAERIERDILQGTIEQELSDAGYPSYFYRPTGWERQLPLMNTSSMVTELAPVVLFVRNVISLGDTLIIDEPESHLHPAMQAAFAIELGRLVKAGFRVLVTTHSSWIVDQFANLVRLSDLSVADRRDLRGGDVALERSQFGAWSFVHLEGDAGSAVSEIPFDRDGIGLDPGYLDVADEQHNMWAKVANRLADKEIE